MTKFEVKDNFKDVKISLQGELLHIANRIFVPAMQRNINNEVSIDEEPFPPIEQSTIKAKLRKGLSPKILTATGLLRSNFIVSAIGTSKVLITIHPIRKEIGKYLQVEGINSKSYGKKFFKFFGINRFMEADAMAFIRSRIDKVISDASK